MAARKAVEQELSKNKILDAARELFVNKGYQQVSMRQIASALNYSHGAIYYHFQNKAELFYALVRKDFAKLNDALNVILKRDGLSNEEQLKEIFLGFIRFGLENQSHYEIMFLIKDKELNCYLEQEPDLTYANFAKAVKSLSHERVTPAMIWSLFLSLHGFVSHYCKSEQTYQDVKFLAEFHVSLLLKSIK